MRGAARPPTGCPAPLRAGRASWGFPKLPLGPSSPCSLRPRGAVLPEGCATDPRSSKGHAHLKSHFSVNCVTAKARCPVAFSAPNSAGPRWMRRKAIWHWGSTNRSRLPRGAGADASLKPFVVYLYSPPEIQGAPGARSLTLTQKAQDIPSPAPLPSPPSSRVWNGAGAGDTGPRPPTKGRSPQEKVTSLHPVPPAEVGGL